MRIQTGGLVPLGYGRYVRSDEVVAVEPITEGRGRGKRTLVWVRGVPDPLIASRSEGAIIDDLVTPPDDTDRVRQYRTVLNEAVRVLDGVPPAFRRLLAEQNGVDLERLSQEAKRVLG